MMDSKIKQAVEEAISGFIEDDGYIDHDFIRDCTFGMEIIINNPSKYGLQPIIEREEG